MLWLTSVHIISKSGDIPGSLTRMRAPLPALQEMVSIERNVMD